MKHYLVDGASCWRDDAIGLTVEEFRRFAVSLENLKPIAAPDRHGESVNLSTFVVNRIIYVAGPYRHDTEAGRVEHVERACRLAHKIMAAGGVPVVVHPAILHGVYGEPSDTDPVERERGVANTLTLALFVRNAGGRCVALTRDDGSLSQGTADEAALFAAQDVLPVFPSEVET